MTALFDAADYVGVPAMPEGWSVYEAVAYVPVTMDDGPPDLEGSELGKWLCGIVRADSGKPESQEHNLDTTTFTITLRLAATIHERSQGEADAELAERARIAMENWYYADLFASRGGAP